MKFSVIIPLYNKAPYVRRALDSVIGQAYKDYDVVVVDDGSSDDSLRVAEEALKGSGLDYQLIHQTNAGVSSARNKGVFSSHGDYLCFLDADDWWAPTFLERMDWLIKEYPEARIYGTNYYYVKNGRQSVCVTTAETGYINYCSVYAEKLQMPLWTGATCMPRDIFAEMEGFNPRLKLGEDFCLWIKVALKYKVAFLNEALSYYYQDSDAAWRLVGKLHAPKTHMLWNLQDMESAETSNPDYKKLIDSLRVYSLFPYYLSNQYRNAAKEELAKVDWRKQPLKTRRLYRLPIPLLKCRQAILKSGSIIKKMIIKYL